VAKKTTLKSILKDRKSAASFKNKEDNNDSRPITSYNGVTINLDDIEIVCVEFSWKIV